MQNAHRVAQREAGTRRTGYAWIQPCDIVLCCLSARKLYTRAEARAAVVEDRRAGRGEEDDHERQLRAELEHILGVVGEGVAARVHGEEAEAHERGHDDLRHGAGVH